MRDIFNEIWSTLRQNKLRTALTGFAVAWGIFMIIALIGAGNGVLNAVLGNTEQQLTDFMQLRSWYTSKSYNGMKENRKIYFDDVDYSNLDKAALGEKVGKVSPVILMRDSLIYKDKFLEVYFWAAKPVMKDIMKAEMCAGRYINDIDIREQRKSLVISDKEADIILGKGKNYADLIGEVVKVGAFNYSIVGVYKADAKDGRPLLHAPFTTIATIYNTGKYVDRLFFSFDGIDTEEENKTYSDSYRRLFNNHHIAAPDDEATITFQNSKLRYKQMGKAVKYIRTALWILGMFSLLSGIVGVSNIMLISVKERTHEFGIRKSLGAKPWSILRLIIVESIVITSIFGFLGMIAGMGACELMEMTWGQEPMDMGIAQITMFLNPGVDLSVAIKATVLLIITGMLAGLIPAWKASKVKPIEALRAE